MRPSDPASELPFHSSLPAWALPFILLLFFCSGLSGLVYEVIWTRVLLTVFGATLYAVATVLAAFMGGLALGSLVGGRLADRIGRPLQLYGVLEILIAVTALAVPRALQLFDPLYRTLYAAGEASFLQLSLVRFLLSFAVLLVPTTCMGATLPLLSRFLVRRGGTLGGRIGGLYAINTTGAVAGTFLAGFVLVAAAGVWGSIVIAAVISVLVGTVSLLLSARLERRPEPASLEPVPTPAEEPAGEPADPVAQPWWLVRLVLASYAVAGFASLSYQVLWTRALVFRFEILKNTTYAFSAMLTVFLVGLAAGSGLMSVRIDRLRKPARLYGLLLVATGMAGALSLVVLVKLAGSITVVDPLDGAGGFIWGLAVVNVFTRTTATILLPTLLMGMAFPVVARLCVRHLRSVGAGTGRLYALNTFGAILGSFATGFLLIPVFGLSRCMLVLAAVYVLLGALVLLLDPRQEPRQRVARTLLVVLAFAALGIATPGPAPFQALDPGHTIVTGDDGRLAYIEGPLATVAVVENTIGHRTINIDNVEVAGTDRILLTDQKSLAHVPSLLLEQPRTALTVGFGSGGASWSFLQYRELERVDCIEICPTVPRLAYTLRDSNHSLLREWDRRGNLTGRRFWGGRYRIIIDDARSYLRFAGRRYDIIATDCTDLRYKSNANLYDVEYFRLCREAITADGMVVVWMPLGGMSAEVFACAIRTFSHVFPEATIWYPSNEPTHYLLLLGTRQPLRINLTRMVERLARPEIRQDLAEVSLHQVEKILSCYVTDTRAVEERLRGLEKTLNTEATPYLEFESPKFGLGDEPLLTNLAILLEHRTSVLPYLEDATAHPELMERLRRFVAATETIIQGHALLRRLQLTEAAARYLEAQRICPEDASVEFLLRFDDLQRRVDRYPNDLWSATTLAEIALLRNDLPAAASGFGRVLSTAAGLPSAGDSRTAALATRAVLGMARCYLLAGKPELGLRLLSQHAGRLQGNSQALQLVAELRGTIEQE